MEFDPYKYTSFSFHAAGETLRLTRDVARRIERKADGQPLHGFPPVLAFLSTVDSTVQAEAVVDALLEHLAPGDHELVLFDVNRYAPVQALLVNDPGPLTERLRARPQRPFALTVITNATPDTQQVVELRTPAGTDADAAARPGAGVAAERVLAVARRAAVPAGRPAVRLRRRGTVRPRAARQRRGARRERRAQGADVGADPAAQQPVPCLPGRAHRRIRRRKL